MFAYFSSALGENGSGAGFRDEDSEEDEEEATDGHWDPNSETPVVPIDDIVTNNPAQHDGFCHEGPEINAPQTCLVAAAPEIRNKADIVKDG